MWPLTNKKAKEVKDTSSETVGGFAFLLSLALLLPTSVLFFRTAISQIIHADNWTVVIFGASFLVGMLIAHRFIRDHLSVLIHEWKHSIVSNLVGNRNNKMEVHRNSGSLQYEYTKKTAHYNAFIALAPYILPVFTFLGSILALALGSAGSHRTVMIIGISYGIDLLMNARDVSPVQTDITLIRGGYGVGVTYICVWNLLTLSLALAWAFNGAQGISELFFTQFWLFVDIYSGITGWNPKG